MPSMLIINANIISMAEKDRVLENSYIAIQNGEILSIGPMGEITLSSDEQKADLQGRYALPGLIELHAHVVEEPQTESARNRNITDDNPELIVSRAIRNMKEALQAGITTICDCGSLKDFTFKFRHAIEMGALEGPHLFICGPLLTAPGGHGAEYGWEIKGQELPKAVCELAKLNVDFVKIINDPIAYTLSELTEAVAEAHGLGMRVACHAFTEDAIWLALHAGCDSIEHGVGCSKEMISYIQENVLAIVPTYIAALKSSVDLDKSLVSQRDADQYFYPWLELLQKHLPICLATDNMLIGAGSDAGFPPIHFASLIEEIQSFVAMGASTFQALSSATKSASEIRGLSNKLGTIQVGKSADIIVTNRNPLEDINALTEIVLVIKGGNIVKNQLI